MAELNRRKFLTYVGTGITAMAVASSGLGALAPRAEANGKQAASHLFGFKRKVSGLNFTPIKPTDKDDLVLPNGFRYDVIASYGDVINKKGDTFGYNNDFTLYFPINNSSDRGLLWVNHEYTSDLWVTGKKGINGKYTKDQIQKLLYNQGGSIIEVYRDENGQWKMDKNSKYARRITGLTPMKLTGPAKGSQAVGNANTVQGTFANCSGGMTLWNTVLSAEENYESTCEDASLNETHYGWIVEIDPFNEKFEPRKHTALGRFHHENSAMGLANDGRVVVYMGDDKTDACVYKFISKNKYVPSRKQANSDLLAEGTLYAANMKKGQWVALTIEAVREKAKGKPELLGKFKTQADVLVNAHEAAILLGATPTDRPEDVEISPFDKTVFIAHTNNSNHGNIHGHITRFVEANDDLGSLTFDFEIFAAGGRQSGFSAPDNLTFDSEGNLWTVTDISSSSLNKGVHSTFKNNGVFVIPSMGKNQGEAFQFASAPVEAELTGPSFTKDETTLFLSVQHPGEGTVDKNKPTSMWPHRKGDNQPRPSVVAITGFKY
ncbi:secreted PhoX family phosphatase [Oikeobacillus pervagus]|uniref:Secreted PhoX family phosphatase n=1 Tax=Oikeobacillus pervagus TaxID=1325931 RepID=A0AAJ1T1W1_9BACI|nr:PhoX family phosphatase [Oikeobacillus pervagus]MDQ0215272.1 secreted PhoX family phosphatase [Oikeobacillus pervagus]